MTRRMFYLFSLLTGLIVVTAHALSLAYIENQIPPATDKARSLYYYGLAAKAWEKDKFRSGQWFLLKAIEFDTEDFSPDYHNAVALRKKYLND